MPLATGLRLGPYEIMSPLGSGGMGEVYHARDTQLGRDVAIKVLPSALANDEAFLTRFEKEARLAASLNHPNIVTIYGVGRKDATPYIAMELVRGRTLHEALGTGPLRMRTVVDVAAQMAAGLAKAHEAGIVHRDLKPRNVMITTDGLVKILDFGLGKLDSPPPHEDSITTMPPEDVTRPGTVMGTPDYMSPEQARAVQVDFRSDQFSFGSMLYQLVTGRRPFQRPSTAQTLAAIIDDDPKPIAEVNPRVPVAVRTIVERCLAKNPDHRYGSTRDLASDLDAVRAQLSGDHTGAARWPTAAFASAWWQRRRLVVVALVALVVMGIAASVS